MRKLKLNLKSLRNKEFTIFVGCVVVIALVFIVAGAVKSIMPYSGKDVVMNFGSDLENRTQYNVEEVQYETGEPIVAEDNTIYPDDWVVGDRVDVLTEEELAEMAEREKIDESPDSVDETVTQEQEPGVAEGLDGVEEQVPVTVEPVLERPSGEQYIAMVLHWVCGIDDDMYQTWMSYDLRTEFRARSGVEPYASLMGNKVYKNISTPTEQTVTFVAGDGQTYQFEVRFDDDIITMIEPY